MYRFTHPVNLQEVLCTALLSITVWLTFDFICNYAPSTVCTCTLCQNLHVWLGLPSTLIHHHQGEENWAFWKCSKIGEFVNAGRLCIFYVWTENTWKTKLFEKDDRVMIIMWLPSICFPRAIFICMLSDQWLLCI